MKRAVLGALAASLVLAIAPSQAATSAPVTPAALTSIGESQQVIVVTAASAASKVGTLRAYEKRPDGTWLTVLTGTRARLGWAGLVAGDQRRQASGKTPAGTYAITRAFGRLPNPGTSLNYLQVDHDDVWLYEPNKPQTYNTLQTARIRWRVGRDHVEHLWDFGMQYDYAAVLDFNLPKGPFVTLPNGIVVTQVPADTSRGGGIFLHVSNGHPTAGCIAIAEDRMRTLLDWMDPAKSPVIVIGTSSGPLAIH